MRKNIIITAITAIALLIAAPVYADGTHVSVMGEDGGRILNCFGWRYNTIKEKISEIAAANYSAVQVTTVQPLPSASEFDGKFHFTDQLLTPIPDWYRIYAPTALRMITTDDAADNTPLGTRGEFDAMVAEAHTKGISVVAGVEANQLFKGSASKAGVTVTAYEAGLNFDFKDPSRKSFTGHAINEAVEDIVYVNGTSDTKGDDNIAKVVSFVKELYAAGVDGICWYHAKYIPLLYGQGYYSSTDAESNQNSGYEMPPNKKYITKSSLTENDTHYEGSNFWPEVTKAMNYKDDGTTALSVPMFSYGNLNLDPNCKGERMRNNSNTGYTIDHDPSYFANGITDDGNWNRPFREYTKYMRVVDSWYAKSAIMQDGVSYANGYWTDLQSDFKYHAGFKSSEITGAYAAEPTDIVYQAEDQNTFLNNPEIMFEPMSKSNSYHENRPTDQIAAACADRVYADMAAHNGSTTVYFARPYSKDGNFVLGQDLDDLTKTSYAYFEDVNNWAGGDASKITVKDGDAASISGNVHLVGKHNGNNVFLWNSSSATAPAKITFSIGSYNSGTYDFVKGATYDATTQVVAMTKLPDVSSTDPTTSDYLTVYIRDNIGDDENRDFYVFATKDGAGAFDNENWPGYKAEKTVQDEEGRKWFYVRVPKNIWERVLYNDKLIISAYTKGTTSFDKGPTKVGQTAEIGSVVSDQWFIITDDKAGDNAIQYRDVKHVSLPSMANEPLRFKGKSIAEVNKYHKLLNGEKEYKEAAYNPDGTRLDVASICRQHGAVLVIRDPEGHPGSHNVGNTNHNLVAGTYTDQITGNTFNVTSDKINGEIGESGIAVIYNKDEVESAAFAVSPVSGRANQNMEVTLTNRDGYEVEYQIANNKEMSDKNNIHNSGKSFANHADGTLYTNVVSKWTSLNGTSSKITLSTDNYTQSTNSSIGYFTAHRSYRGWGHFTTTYSEYNPYTITLYLNVRYRKSGDTNWTTVSSPYQYTLYTGDGSGTLYVNQLYFNLPEGVEPDSLSIYAWNDEAGTLFPLVKRGGDRLQKYYKTDEERKAHWYAPVLNVYDYKTYNRWGYEDDVYGKITDNDLITMLGTDDPNEVANKYYDPEAESHNDAVSINHGKFVCRYTIGLPGLHFDNIKFRLSYNHPQGYTEQLETMELTAGEDQFYSISQDDEGRLSIGHDIEMVGDAIYDNSTWGYYFTKKTDSYGNVLPEYEESEGTIIPTQNWVSGFWEGTNDSDPTRLSYEPNESNELSVNGAKAEVYTWSGQMIHGKSLRFGERPDFATSYVPDVEKNKTAPEFKRFFLAVPTTYIYKVRSSNTVTGSSKTVYDNWYMSRGYWYDQNQIPDPTVKVDENESSGSSTTPTKTVDDLTWTWPSGYYKIKFYRIFKGDESTYYMTVTQPSLTYEDGGTSYEYLANNSSSRNETVSFAGLKYPGSTNETSTTEATTGSSATDPYFYIDLPHVGRAGYKGSTISISNNVDGEPSKFVVPNFILEGKETKSSSSTISEYSSLYPETGAYRIIYSLGHGNSPTEFVAKANKTSENLHEIVKEQKDQVEDTNPTAKFMLGFNVTRYTKEELFNFRTTEKSKADGEGTVPAGYWTTYSDGLPRLKPKGVSAYYASGYVRGGAGTDTPISALYFTKLEGDTLPANTGLMLCVDATAMQSEAPLNLGGEVPDKPGRVYIYFEPADPDKDYVWHQAGTNFLQPWLAADESVSNSSENAWKQYPDVKRPSSKYLNYQFGKGYWTWHIRNDEGKVIGTEDRYGVGFYPTSYRYLTNNYEVRKAFVSIPRKGVISDDPGDDDQTFGAKPHYAKVSSNSDVVATAPVDLIWGDDGGVLETVDGITTINYDKGNTDDKVYNLQGQRVSNPHRGVYIRGGKKILIK